VLLAVVMIVVWISWVTSAALGWAQSGVPPIVHEADPFRKEWTPGWSPTTTLLFVTPGFMLLAILSAVVVSIGLDFVINLNEFSLHSLYRNRLIRSYLGASRPFRRPNPFTGFDPNDDLQMSDLEWQRTSAETIPARQRPLHVV